MPKTTEKQWTVMVYLAGDNNLDSAGVNDLQEMKKVGSTDHINVIAQFDRQGRGMATKRYFIRKSGTLSKDVVGSLGETNMGDPFVLEDFIKWGYKNYPAKHYLLVVWNHGNGWNDENVYRVARNMLRLNISRRGQVVLPAKGASKGSISIHRIRAIEGKKFRHALFNTTIMKAVKIRGIAYDDDAQDFLDNIEMKRLLASAKKILRHKIDILGMDACLMSMAEVAYQLRDSVSLTVGSEEVEPGDGWPYDRILSKLIKKPMMMPNELSTIIVNEYIASYPANAGVTQSACDLSKSGVLANTINQLADTLSSHLTDAARATIVECRFQTQAYESPDYIDLYDFCDLLEGESDFDDIRTACGRVKNAIQHDGVIIKSGYKGKKVEHSNGLSIYFPQKKLSSLYATLDFTKKTSWGKFLQKYINHTRRPD